MIKEKVPVYYWKKFVNPEWKQLQDSSRIDGSQLQELYFFTKASEKRQAIVSVWKTCMAVEIREVDGGFSYNVDWNDPVFLELCKIAGPKRRLLQLASILFAYGYTYHGMEEVNKK